MIETGTSFVRPKQESISLVDFGRVLFLFCFGNKGVEIVRLILYLLVCGCWFGYLTDFWAHMKNASLGNDQR